ncbi:MAG: acyl-CoA dehydrogenase [bacterium]
MTFHAPTRDIEFALQHMAGFDKLQNLDPDQDISDDLVAAILEEAGKLADHVIAPVNKAGDLHGVKLENGVVRITPEFHKAYRQMVEGGWNALSFPEEYGGQGLPKTLALAVTDIMSAACISLQLCNILTTGSVKALLAVGTQEQKKTYLEKLISGEWSGTMNLTEPQSGSDLSAIATKAEPVGDGTYRLSGNKIFITYGDQDMVENICHLVLARLPNAPDGTRGISMFLVPKYRVDENGNPGVFNNVICTGTEHKLGQHGAPACSLTFGEGGASIGTLVGKENEGLKNMFIMMNSARIDVGVQGVACAERSFQAALAYAQERKQGRAAGQKSGDFVAIFEHADVRRMLYTMKSLTEASRAICYATMVASDIARQSTDREEQTAAKEREELLTPVAKAFSTDRGVEITNLGIQIHGGMGYVEESGAPQPMRDVRITPIYEGTNGIQAIDMMGRKLGIAHGKLALDFLTEIKESTEQLLVSPDDALQAIGISLSQAQQELLRTTQWMIAKGIDGLEDKLAGATPYLDQFGYVAGGYYLALGAIAAASLVHTKPEQAAYYKSKIALARFYMDNILPRATALSPAIMAGGDSVAKIDPALLAG